MKTVQRETRYDGQLLKYGEDAHIHTHGSSVKFQRCDIILQKSTLSWAVYLHLWGPKAYVITVIKVHYTAQDGHQHLLEREIQAHMSCQPIKLILLSWVA